MIIKLVKFWSFKIFGISTYLWIPTILHVFAIDPLFALWMGLYIS